MVLKLRSFRFLALLGLSLALGCDGDTSVFIRIGDYRGTWDCRYNLTIDDCGIVEPGIAGFVDLHEIEQEGASVTIVATSDSGFPLKGAVNEDNSLATEQRLEGDIFGIGIFCELYQGISYQPTDTNVTTSLFVRTITCEDGFFCTSRGLGESKRR